MTAQPKHWGPSAPGKLFTRTFDWTLELFEHSYRLRVGRTVLQGEVTDLGQLRVSAGMFWATLALALPGRAPISLDGIPNADADRLAVAVTQALRRVRITELLQNFDEALRPVMQWASSARSACKVQLTSRGWLTREFKEIQSSLKPRELAKLLAEPEVVLHLEAQGPGTGQAKAKEKGN